MEVVNESVNLHFTHIAVSKLFLLIRTSYTIPTCLYYILRAFYLLFYDIVNSFKDELVQKLIFLKIIILLLHGFIHVIGKGVKEFSEKLPSTAKIRKSCPLPAKLDHASPNNLFFVHFSLCNILWMILLSD